MKTRLAIAVLMALAMLGLVGALAAAQSPDVTNQAAPGRWVAASQPGFGNPNIYAILALAPFGQHLYAGAEDDVDGGDLWRTANGVDWAAVTTNGFGDADNIGVEHLAEFKGHLYAGTMATESARIYRSSDGQTWNEVTPSGLDATQKEIGRLVVFNNQLYATTWSYTDTQGCEIWRTSSGDAASWTRVVNNGFGNAGNIAILSTEVFNGRLYAGTFKNGGGEVWRSASGDPGSWTQVNVDGFGNSANIGISALAAFDGYLYASTRPVGIGIQVWRCQSCDGSDWNKVMDNALGDPATNRGSGLIVYQGQLYLVAGNRSSGLRVWRTANGTNWENIGQNGLVGPGNLDVYWGNTLAIFANTLFVGTTGDLLGHTSQGQVLRYWPGAVYLPVVRR